jgi:pyroglutamyl-peptidase
MKLLLTGFEKFFDFDVNPTELLAKYFNGKKIANVEIIGKVIPLRFNEIEGTIIKLIEDHNPDIIIMMGQANRSMISLEKIAINYVDSNSQPYNCGTVVFPQKIKDEG